MIKKTMLRVCAASLLLLSSISTIAEDIRYIVPGVRYYLKGVFSDDLVIVTAVDRTGNRVKIQSSEGAVDWVSPSKLLTDSQSTDRDMTRGTVAVGVIGAILCAATEGCGDAEPAEQEFSICNKSDGKMFAVVTYESSDGWETRGWFPIEKQSCKRVASGFTGERVYYFANNLNDTWWGGDTKTCVHPKIAFTSKWSNECTEDYVIRGFKEYRLDGKKKGTVSLVISK
jgi:uncharacterized membrane protein